MSRGNATWSNSCNGIDANGMAVGGRGTVACYLLLIMELVTVTELTSLPVEVNICTFHT